MIPRRRPERPPGWSLRPPTVRRMGHVLRLRDEGDQPRQWGRLGEGEAEQVNRPVPLDPAIRLAGRPRSARSGGPRPELWPGGTWSDIQHHLASGHGALGYPVLQTADFPPDVQALGFAVSTPLWYYIPAAGSAARARRQPDRRRGVPQSAPQRPRFVPELRAGMDAHAAAAGRPRHWGLHHDGLIDVRRGRLNARRCLDRIGWR